MSGEPKFFDRHIRAQLVEALDESRAVALLGARQAGKSTLVRDVAANELGARVLNLDDEATLFAARDDPVGLIADTPGPIVIDEVQRAPNLLLAIKRRLDLDNARGQFLLTGSANVLTLPTVADTLPGRVDYLNLWPLSQGELSDIRETFVDDLFAAAPRSVTAKTAGRRPLAELFLRGGFPDAISRSSHGRPRFFASYVASIIGRDLPDVANVRNVENVERLLSVIATRTGGLVSDFGMSNELGITAKTVAAHSKILEDLFLVRTIRPWHSNLGSRQIKSPKCYLVDTGLLCFLIGANEDRIVDDGGIAGAVIENFVAMELLRHCDWASEPVSVYHYRDRRGREVDLVLERRNGDVVGVEVKSAATVASHDLHGLRYLRDSLGKRFKAGAVVYTGTETLPFGDRLTAVPLESLWSGSKVAR